MKRGIERKKIVEEFSVKKSFENLLHLKRWGLRGGLAILDQGLFSGSNFVLNVLLVRWLSPSDYGAFSIAFVIYLFFCGFHNALILEPMSVFGTAKYFGDLKNYILNQFIIHAVISIAIGLLALLAGYISLHLRLTSSFISWGVIDVSVFLPLMLLMWVARRACYILGKSSWAVFGSLVYSIVLIGSATIIHDNSSLDSNLLLWFVAMGMASLAGSSVIIGLIHFDSFSVMSNKLTLSNLINEQWQFGKWIVFATFLYFTGSQIQVFFAASMLDLKAAGAFRAVQNLILPILQILAAVTTMIFPSIAYEFGRRDYEAVRLKSVRFSVIMVSISLFYELILFLGADWINHNLYNGKYGEYVWLIPIVGLVPVFNAFTAGLSLTLRSLQKPHYYLIDKTVVAIIGFISAFFFIRYWNLAGAIFSLILIEITGFITHWLLYRRWFTNLVRGPLHEIIR
jgi:O-antigen/teichoic acid export membrane protein